MPASCAQTVSDEDKCLNYVGEQWDVQFLLLENVNHNARKMLTFWCEIYLYVDDCDDNAVDGADVDDNDDDNDVDGDDDVDDDDDDDDDVDVDVVDVVDDDDDDVDVDDVDDDGDDGDDDEAWA